MREMRHGRARWRRSRRFRGFAHGWAFLRCHARLTAGHVAPGSAPVLNLPTVTDVFDVPNRKLNVELTDAQILKCLATWKVPAPR